MTVGDRTIFLITVNGCGACQNLKDHPNLIAGIKSAAERDGYTFVHINLDHFGQKSSVLSKKYLWPNSSLNLVLWFPCYVRKNGNKWDRFGRIVEGQIQPNQSPSNIEAWIRSWADSDLSKKSFSVIKWGIRKYFILLPMRCAVLVSNWKSMGLLKSSKSYLKGKVTNSPISILKTWPVSISCRQISKT